jgi:hypothetical protein
LSVYNKIFNSEKPLPKKQNPLLIYLLINRKKALEYIPDDLKDEFLIKIYSDFNLKNNIRKAFNKKLNVDEKSRYKFLRWLIVQDMTEKDFAFRLMLYGIDPQNITNIMLEGY